MGRGRRPTPDALKELAGNPGHRPLNDQAPQPEREAPEKPKGMTKAASREWDRMVPKLLQLGVLSSIDGKSLATYCEAFGLAEDAYRDMKKYGLMIDEPVLDKFNQPVIFKGEMLFKHKDNPAVSVWVKTKGVMLRHLVEFGLTPASRSKLKIDKKPSKDPLEAELAWMPPGTTADVHRQPASLAEN